jgi:anaerobic magnesium-protoporphyrin IX monomethyl ester cyclase
MTLNRNIKVLLVNPPLPHNRKLKRVYPMGLLYLASYLRQHNPYTDVRVFNPQVSNIGFRETLRTILAEEWDVLGLGYWTCQFPFVGRLSRAVKESRPNGLIVHGGVDPTLRPEAAALTADWVLLHEGERSFSGLIHALHDGDFDFVPPGSVRQTGDTFQSTVFDGFIDDLDALPFPSFDLLDLKKYFTPMHVIGGQRLPIIGSRGCPYNCSYCVSPRFWKRRVRWRSPENIVDEMEHHKSKFGIDKFHFWDDNFLLRKSHALGVAEEILRRNLKVKWLGLTRASHVVKQEEIIPVLARAGLLGFEIGIESANPEAYTIVGKNESLENLLKACEIQKRNELFPMYTYMAYLPGDTIRGAYEQARFMDALLRGLPRYDYFHHLPFDIYIGQCCTPHVGTQMHVEVEKLGRPMWEDEEDFHHSATCFLPHSLLEDIPLRKVAKPSVDDRVFAVIVAYVAIADYLSYDGLFEKVRNVAAFNALLDKFWDSCDGKSTLMDIAGHIHGTTPMGLELDDMLRFLAAMCLTLGQVGALDSRGSESREPVQRKLVPYGHKHVYRVLLQVSRIWGKIFGQEEFTMRKHRSHET